MGVLLVIATFAIFILLDWLLSRRANEQEARAAEAALTAVPVPEFAIGGTAEGEEPSWVAGYRLPDDRYYHQGHVWARVLSGDVVAVGLDDFARRLLGRAERVELPEIGAYLHQGGTGVHIEAAGRAADLVSPIDGEVLAVNRDLKSTPRLATDEPYRRGWLYQIRSGNLAAALRNLLSGRLARRWMEDSREQLDVRLMALSGSVLQDGGEPSLDFGRHVEIEEWKRLVETFLLTEGYERPQD